MRRASPLEATFDLFNSVLMLLIVIVMAYPFLFVLFYSVSDPSQVKPGLLLWPQGLNFSSYRVLLRNPVILNAAFISVARSVIGTVAMLAVTAAAAYGISKRNLIGVRFFRVFFTLTMYFSGGIIPTYLLIKTLGLTNSFAVYIVPNMVNVFNMILIRTYIEGIPPSLEESAIMVGANELQVFRYIIIPMSTPVLAAVGLFTFVNQWNAFIDVQLYNYMSPDLYPLQYVLYNFLMAQSQSVEQAKRSLNLSAITPQSLKTAITVITIIPVFLIYPVLQKYFVSGLMIGSVKE
jgi:putative aldouronate transport system permease protein